MSAGSGNALQAAVATALGTTLANTPNFITAPEGYLVSLQAFLAPKGLAFLKIPLAGLPLPQPALPWAQLTARRWEACVPDGRRHALYPCSWEVHLEPLLPRTSPALAVAPLHHAQQ